MNIFQTLETKRRRNPTTNGYTYHLCHKEGALNVVETELTPDTAGDYLSAVG